MNYIFYFDKISNSFKAEFFDKGFEEFGGWFWYESAAFEIHKKVLDFINSGTEKSETIHGNEYVSYISKKGLSIQPIEAFEPDLNPEDYPESKRISLDVIKQLVLEWQDFISGKH